VLKWVRRNNIEDVYVTTGYLGHLIRLYCGDGHQWGIRLQYTEESEPLGTVGALSLMRDKLNDTFLVINGDILTDLNLNAFIAHHKESGTPLTIATTIRTHKMDYGVIDEKDQLVTAFREKPTLLNLVSMGVYCMEPSILQFIPSGTPYGFDDLVLHLLGLRVPVHTYRHAGAWLDIGRADDFNKAQEIDWDEQIAALNTIAA
jgi:mannose-1-phosphate guanylyltransferase